MRMAPRSVVLPGEPEGALDAVEEAAALWGGSLERRAGGGTLRIPVAVGLRHGLLDGDVVVERSGPATSSFSRRSTATTGSTGRRR